MIAVWKALSIASAFPTKSVVLNCVYISQGEVLPFDSMQGVGFYQKTQN